MSETTIVPAIWTPIAYKIHADYNGWRELPEAVVSIETARRMSGCDALLMAQRRDPDCCVLLVKRPGRVRR